MKILASVVPHSGSFASFLSRNAIISSHEYHSSSGSMDDAPFSYSRTSSHVLNETLGSASEAVLPSFSSSFVASPF